MVKIGMTRRLEPLDRVREMGDASVPFHYDVYAMVFSRDAGGPETSRITKLLPRQATFALLVSFPVAGDAARFQFRPRHPAGASRGPGILRSGAVCLRS